MADLTINGLVKLSRPCDNDPTKNIALNKYDTAGLSNTGSVKLSRAPCSPCNAIAVSDNDQRMFDPYLEYYNSYRGGGAEAENKRTGTGTTEAIFTYKQTNVAPTGTTLNCGVKDSLYYGLQKDHNDIFVANKRLKVPKAGQYLVSFQVRMFIDPGATNNIPFGVARARVVVNGTNTTIGDKKEWLHRNWLVDLNNFNNNDNGSKSKTWALRTEMSVDGEVV